jgi:HTH-type transcriptional regulator/antitoxin HigA
MPAYGLANAAAGARKSAKRGAKGVLSMASNRVWPDVVIPPGATLAEELAVRGLSQTELARRMRRPVQAVNEIIRGKKAITATTALQLEDVLEISADFWLRLEAAYQLNLARHARRRARPRRPAVHAS